MFCFFVNLPTFVYLFPFNISEISYSFHIHTVCFHIQTVKVESQFDMFFRLTLLFNYRLREKGAFRWRHVNVESAGNRFCTFFDRHQSQSLSLRVYPEVSNPHAKVCRIRLVTASNWECSCLFQQAKLTRIWEIIAQSAENSSKSSQVHFIK